MRYILLFILVLIFLSCQTTNKTNKNSNDQKALYDESVDYETLMYTKYNSANLIIEDKVYSPYSRGIYLDTIVATTSYFYDNKKNLKEKLRINETFKDTTKTIYLYDIHNQLILEIKIKHRLDTVLIIKKDHFKEDGFTVIKTMQLQKDPLTEDNSTIPFDTTYEISKERYSDSLIITKVNYSISNGNPDFKDSIIYKYNDQGNLIKRFTVDKIGDTISWENIEYLGKKRIKNDLFIDKGNHLISETYDSLGYLDKIINIDLTTNVRDTSFHTCDDKGNVVFSKWK